MTNGPNDKSIFVCGLDAVPDMLRTENPSHLVTLINQDMLIDTPQSIGQDRHLRLIMHDVATPLDGYTPPNERHIGELLSFGRAWLSDGEATETSVDVPATASGSGSRADPLLIHCWAGISRSTAAAYILVCALNPEHDEADIASLLRRSSPTATPNPMMIEIADRMLDRDGRMITAIARIGRGALAASGKAFRLPAQLDRTSKETGPIG